MDKREIPNIEEVGEANKDDERSGWMICGKGERIRGKWGARHLGGA
jgi:hypothetical protein